MKCTCPAFCSLVLLLGCGPNASDSSPAPSGVAEVQERIAELRIRRAFVRENTAFAVDLYQQLREEPGNLFFSPHSLSTALAMTYAGARGETEKQMAEALHFTLPQAKLHAAFAELQTTLSEAEDASGVQLHVANSLWPAQGLALKRDFLECMNRNYQASFTPLDYHQPEAARQTINRWVENQTRDKIKELLQPGIIDPATVLVLANAIYFRGTWAMPFEADHTRLQPFHLSASETISTPLMHQPRLEGKYYANGEVQILGLPYQGGGLSMVVVLPKKVEGLADLERGLTSAKVQDWLDQLSRGTQVDVWLPKFKMTSYFLLNDALKALGMVDAFGAADFSGMFESRGPHIAAVVHKACVEVNEEGTEAAAATGVVMKVSAPPTFRADHPFLFLIRDTRVGSVLFMGRCVHPA